MKILVIAFLVFIVASLASAGYFIMKDKGRGDRAVKALTLRVALSVTLFVLLMLAYHFGYISQKL